VGKACREGRKGMRRAGKRRGRKGW